MRLRNSRFTFAVLTAVILFHTSYARGQLQNASLTQIKIDANDLVYDSLRNRIYATVGSSVGFPAGNSIWVIDPDKSEVIDTIFVGSEPNAIAISDDTSKVYIGIDGALSFRCWEPATESLGPLVPIVDDGEQNARAREIVVRPGSPDTVVVMRSSRDLFLYREGVLVDDFFANSIDSITFSDSDYLFSYDWTSVDTLRKFQIVDDEFLLVGQSGALVTGSSLPTIEATGTGLFATNGDYVDVDAFESLGDFGSLSGTFEPVEKDRTVFYLGHDWLLQMFSTENLELIDSVALFDDGSFLVELISAGKNRLACLSSTGQIGLINNVPVSDELILGDINRDCILDLLDIQPFVEVLLSNEYSPLADINFDGQNNLVDVPPFIDLLGK